MNRTTRTLLGLIAAVTVLAGCASRPDVIAAGKDAHGKNLYAIAGHESLNAAASREAIQYCGKRGQSAVIEDTAFRDYNFTFSCSTPN